MGTAQELKKNHLRKPGKKKTNNQSIPPQAIKKTNRSMRRLICRSSSGAVASAIVGAKNSVDRNGRSRCRCDDPKPTRIDCLINQIVKEIVIVVPDQ